MSMKHLTGCLGTGTKVLSHCYGSICKGGTDPELSLSGTQEKCRIGSKAIPLPTDNHYLQYIDLNTLNEMLKFK